MSKRTKARRAHYSVSKSPLQLIFHDKDMIVERPTEMDFEEYKIMRRIQNKVLRTLIRRPTPRRPTIPQRLGYNFHPLIPQDGKIAKKD